MASKRLSPDQQNFVQLGIACVDEVKLVFKDIFKSQINPTDLYYVINSCSELTSGRHKLRPDQLGLCSLSPPQVPDYNLFDVTLLYTLIRNLCPNLKPSKGWGKIPDSTDTKIGDDIERLRIFRNDVFAHVKSSEVPDATFLQIWNDLKGIIRRAQKFVTLLGYKVNYEERLEKIEKSDCGSDAMEKYLHLQAMVFIWKQSQIADTSIPGINIRGNEKVQCWGKAYFEAEMENCLDTDNWPISWVKVRGGTTKVIDISKEKYNGSTSRRLVINEVEEDDEGEYQAVISREKDRRHFKVHSNTIFLEVIEAQRDICGCESGQLSIVQELKMAEADVNVQDKKGRVALIIASEGGHLNSARELIKAGAKVNTQDNEGNTALITALMRGHLSIVEELIKAGADVNLQDQKGRVPLIIACADGYLSSMQKLLKAGAKVNIRDNEGDVALITALMRGHISIVQELINAGASVNVADGKGRVALIIASEDGHLNTVQELIKAGADVNLQDQKGRVALTVALQAGHVSIVQELINARASVNVADGKGHVALIIASEDGHLNTVQELIKAGANINLQDQKGRVALTVALQAGHVSIVQELINAGADVNL